MKPIHTESARTTRESKMSSVALHRVATYGYARRSTITCASKKAARKAKGAPKQKAQPPPVQKVDDSVDVTSSSADSNPDVTPTPEVNPYSSAGYEGDNFIPYGNTSGAALRITDVMLSVGDVDLLTEASVAVMPGQVVGLVGGNGCGKSTLLKCIAGRRSVQDGEIAIAKELEVGYFEQTAVSGSQMTVYEEARS
jgi:ABC-type glutathione transport system ATPase component